MKAIFAFIAGAAIGSVATWQIVKKKYEQMAQEEIQEVRDFYSSKKPHYEGPETSDEAKKDTTPHVIEEKPDIMEYAAKLKDEGYTDYSTTKPTPERTVAKTTDGPVTIPPEEFGEIEGYGKVSLMYYADGVLADDIDRVVDNIGETVGEDFADHFGEYEDDSVYIRNDARKCDYEILRSLKTYKEVLAEDPYKAEV